MQKKRIIMLIIILAIIALLITVSNKLIKKQNKNQIALKNSEIVYEPNVPILSAGMIPVKRDGDNWVITSQNDSSWYDYVTGTPAYIMLNDGTYQSELLPDMTGKKLVGNDTIIVSEEELGSIYMWIPRFVYDEETTKYIPAEKQIGGDWVIPEMFVYEVENEKMPDYSLSGIWVSLDMNSNCENIINQMNNENNKYGFIANIKPRQITEADTSSIAKLVEEGYMDAILNLDNTNRIILQIINTNKVEPIKAKAYYAETEGKINIEVTYSKNGILKILAEDGTEMTLTETNGIITANTGDKEIEGPTYTIIIVDNKNNQKKITVTGIIPSYYGKLVTNYTCPADEELNGTEDELKWRIFYKDSENIYLIADDYVPYTSLPTTSTESSTPGKSLNAGDTYYKAYFTNVIGSYTGSAWIRENETAKAIADKWLTWVNTHTTSVNNNIKAVAYMMDTLAWNKFVGDKAEYAIGGPTIEMYCASYKTTHPEKYIEWDASEANGYKIKWSDANWAANGENYYCVWNLPTNVEFNNIYIDSDKSKAYGCRLASPSVSSDYSLLVPNFCGEVNVYTYGNGACGFRPIVCLNNGTELQKNPVEEWDGENETYSIILPIEATAEYDDITEKITVNVSYTKYGIEKIIDEEGTNLVGANCTNLVVTPSENKSVYTFIIVDKEGNTKKLKVKITTIPSYYGKLVTNYTCPADEELDGTENELKWRIFYKDSDNIYLIADDYVPYTSLPVTSTESGKSGESLNAGNTSYRGYFTNVIGSYSGSAWIRENTTSKVIANKWLTWVNDTDKQNSTSSNIKAVAYIMDTLAWSKFAGDKAKYAIGGPTLEMYCASYKVTHPERYIEWDKSEINGYKTKWSDTNWTTSGENYYYVGGIPTDGEINKMYTNSDYTNAYGYWLASPSVYNTERLLKTFSGGVTASNYYITAGDGFRPIVCLKSNVQLVSNGDGTYRLQ